MAVWLIRAGSQGEYEQKFIQENRVYVTWDDLDVNLATLGSRNDLIKEMKKRYPEAKERTIANWASQVWPFAHDIKKSDLIVLPLKMQRTILIGEVSGEYHYEPKGPSPFFHWLPVAWIDEAIPRSNFGQDLLYSFGAFKTICRIQRNNAEKRIKKMQANDWASETLSDITGKKTTIATDESLVGTESTDLEEIARDQIARLIEARFKGHGLTRLVESILKAQGYVTYRSPEGADGGADILAGKGSLGFGAPKLCVEVKSERSQIDRPTVDKLLGAITKFGAEEGLFVSWSGFKSNVQKELAPSFFRVRLWTQKELLEAFFANYDKLEEDVKAELPLKRIWIVAHQED